MGYLNNTTTGLMLSVGALTLAFTGFETTSTAQLQNMQNSNKENIEIVHEQTQANKFDYIDNMYSTNDMNEIDLVKENIAYLNFIQNDEVQFKELDLEFLQALNELDLIVGKKEPSRKRF